MIMNRRMHSLCCWMGWFLTEFRSKRFPSYLTCALFLLGAREAVAATITWVGPVSGNWSDTSKWDLGRAPLPGDEVVINVNGTYTVTLDVAATVDRILMGQGTSGLVTLEITANNLTLAGVSATTIGLFGELKVTGAVVSSATTMLIQGALNWEGGTPATFTVTFVPLNDPPTLGVLSPLTIPEDAPLQTVPLSGISSGAPDEVQVLTVTAVSSDTSIVPNPTVTYTSPAAVGVIDFAPVADANGTATISVTVTDDGGAAFTMNFVVTVTPVNDPPHLAPLGSALTDEDGLPVFVPLNLFDPDTVADLLTLDVSVSDPPVVSTSVLGTGASRTLVLTPLRDAAGESEVTVKIRDGVLSSSQSFKIRVLPSNDPPSLAPLGAQSMDEDATLELDLVVSDLDSPIGFMTYDLSSDNSLLLDASSFQVTRVTTGARLRVKPLPNASGSAHVTVIVRDNTGVPDSRTFLLTVRPVNDPPVVGKIPNQKTKENTPLPPLDWVLNDVDSDLNTLKFRVDSSDSSLIPQAHVVIEGTGSRRVVKIRPADGKSGSSIVTLTALDGSVESSTSFEVFVEFINDLPEISVVPPVVLDEDQPPVMVEFGVADAEDPATSLKVSVNSSNDALVPGTGIQIEGFGVN